MNIKDAYILIEFVADRLRRDCCGEAEQEFAKALNPISEAMRNYLLNLSPDDERQIKEHNLVLQKYNLQVPVD